MSEFEPDPDNFEERARALARELAESVERAAEQLDLDAIAARIGTTGERVRELADFAGRWLSGAQPGNVRPPDQPASGDQGNVEARRRLSGPHPLDLPTEEQGLALSALDSGRWTVEPGSDELIARGDGPSPSNPVGLVGELRARDWIAATGEVTVVGRDALRRWMNASAS